MQNRDSLENHSIFITFGERNAIMTNRLEFRCFCKTSCLSLLLLTGHLTPQDLRRAPLVQVSPKIILVSAGAKDVATNKGYKHPRAETIMRLLAFTQPGIDVRTIDAFDNGRRQWTSMTINAGLYVTQVDGTYTITSEGHNTWKGDATNTEEDPVRYVYSKASKYYHFEECADAKRIKPENRTTTTEPPPAKELHQGCPRERSSMRRPRDRLVATVRDM